MSILGCAGLFAKSFKIILTRTNNLCFQFNCVRAFNRDPSYLLFFLFTIDKYSNAIKTKFLLPFTFKIIIKIVLLFLLR